MEVLKKTSQIHNKSAALILENGEVLWGYGLGAKKSVVGELCFNTSQTGYQEALTDPSYAKQIITFTFPHIGIVGTNSEDQESKKIYADGCIINQKINFYSNWRAEKDINAFFIQNNIPCLYGVDTRYLTKKLAEEGAKKAALVYFGEEKESLEIIKDQIRNWSGLENLDLAKVVSTNNKYDWNEGTWSKINNNKNTNSYRVTCLDFGIKHNILRNLHELNLNPTVLNLFSSFEEIIDTKPDGIFLSNGPGDPFATGEKIINTLKKLIDFKIPIFGICLGHQILSMALGAKTKKMFQGHRGSNHPVKNLDKNIVEITSQNHGFEVDKKTFSKDIIETHISLFDGTNEGLKHKHLPVFSVQYHPEASPGPHDSNYLFYEFYELIKKHAKKN
ncbi:MAG: carbamoyl phosphate synthase small subunit [Pelagibacteraceae bacterium TMED237]|nr:MAG: carbamoyl phosphate synthase small subunit [Pelagibacteraceae bacterium TMED237]